MGLLRDFALISVSMFYIVAWILVTTELDQKICDAPDYYAYTFECHCPDRWRELRANQAIQGNPNKIPRCDDLIAYLCEVMQGVIVSAILAPLKMVQIIFPGGPHESYRI